MNYKDLNTKGKEQIKQIIIRSYKDLINQPPPIQILSNQLDKVNPFVNYVLTATISKDEINKVLEMIAKTMIDKGLFYDDKKEINLSPEARRKQLLNNNNCNYSYLKSLPQEKLYQYFENKTKQELKNSLNFYTQIEDFEMCRILNNMIKSFDNLKTK